MKSIKNNISEYKFNIPGGLTMKLAKFKKILNKISVFLPDKLFLKIKFRYHFGHKLYLNNPKTFNEKLQWLKLNNRKPEYTQLVDKYEVRKYIKEKIGDEYLIPLLGVYNNFDEINFAELPNQFVLKPNHTSGNVFICRDKSKIDYIKLKKEVDLWLKRKYYWLHREWPYKNVKPKIVCEKFMVDESEKDLKDYKVFCFNGTPKLIQVDYNRFSGHKRNLYDVNWGYVPASFQYSSDPNVKISKPHKLEKVLKLAEKLAKEHPFIRVDFYIINNEIYFGEITFYPEAGFGKFEPKDISNEMGGWINLPLES